MGPTYSVPRAGFVSLGIVLFTMFINSALAKSPDTEDVRTILSVVGLAGALFAFAPLDAIRQREKAQWEAAQEEARFRAEIQETKRREGLS